MFKFLTDFPMKISQLLIGLDQHLHVDNAASHVHKKADRILLDYFLHISNDYDSFDEERNGLLIPLRDKVGK